MTNQNTNTDNYYGFSSTDEVEFDKQGLPVGQHKVMIIGEEPFKDSGLVVEYEIVSSGDYKGKKGKVWYLTRHENPTTANIAKQNIKRIAEATGRAVSATSPLKGRVLQVIVGVQKNDESRTEIKKYLPENAEAPTPF